MRVGWLRLASDLRLVRARLAQKVEQRLQPLLSPREGLTLHFTRPRDRRDAPPLGFTRGGEDVVERQLITLRRALEQGPEGGELELVLSQRALGQRGVLPHLPPSHLRAGPQPHPPDAHQPLPPRLDAKPRLDPPPGGEDCHRARDAGDHQRGHAEPIGKLSLALASLGSHHGE